MPLHPLSMIGDYFDGTIKHVSHFLRLCDPCNVRPVVAAMVIDGTCTEKMYVEGYSKVHSQVHLQRLQQPSAVQLEKLESLPKQFLGFHCGSFRISGKWAPVILMPMAPRT